MLEQGRPLDSDQMRSSGENAAQPALPRLLVIDDDKLHRMIVCRAAAKAGYAPAGAGTYEEAVALAQQAPFDCITLDLSLGPYAGVDILRRLWEMKCKAPIIVISGCDSVTCSETVELARSLDLTVRQTIPKPVDLALLQYCFEQIRDERDAAIVAA